MEKTAMQRSSPLVQGIGLAGWLAITFAAAAVGTIASLDAPGFYAELDRPAWAPPASVFGPVWTVLYLLMGLAAWLVWRERRGPRDVHGVGGALGLFVTQLVANALWSWLFFAWHDGATAFAEILVLLALIALTAVSFWRIRPLAGALLLPYLAWVTFASMLTLAVWQRNPGLL
jgi:tryptophan-rich sensory protein